MIARLRCKHINENNIESGIEFCIICVGFLYIPPCVALQYERITEYNCEVMISESDPLILRSHRNYYGALINVVE